jgi:hypothetical protein
LTDLDAVLQLLGQARVCHLFNRQADAWIQNFSQQAALRGGLFFCAL